MFDFGELRALLTRPPDAAMFEELMALLELMLEAEPDRTREQWFPYVISISKRWPEAIRERFRLNLYVALEGGASSLAGLLDAPKELRWKGERGEHVLMALEDMDVSALDTLEIGCEQEAGGLVVEWLSQASSMRRLRILDLRALALGPRELVMLANAAHLSSLKALLLDGLALREGHVADLLRGPSTRNLTALCLRRCRLSGQVVLPTLASGPARLERLDVSDNPDLSADALAAYLLSEGASRLRSLDLARATRGGPIIAALAANRALRLTHLNLAQTRLDDADLRPLTTSASAETLQVLNLKANRLGVEAAQALAAGRWPALEVLRVNHNRLLARGIEAILRAPHHMPRLKELRASYTIPAVLGPQPLRGEPERAAPGGPLLGQLDVYDVRGPGTTLRQALTLREQLPAHAWLRCSGRGSVVSRGQLEVLDLSDAHHIRHELHETLRDALPSPALDGLKRLVWRGVTSRADLFEGVLRHPRLATLEALDLSNSRQLNPVHLRALTRTGAVDHLRVLDMSGCHLQPESCRMLLSAPKLERLERLELTGNFWSLSLLHEAIQAGEDAPLLTARFVRPTHDNARYHTMRAQLDRLLAEDPTLTILELGDAALRDEDMVLLASLPGMRHVRRINLSARGSSWYTVRPGGPVLTLRGVLALLESAHIDWTHTSIHHPMTIRYFQPPAWSGPPRAWRVDMFRPFLPWHGSAPRRPIQELGLAACALEDEDLDALATWPRLTDAEVLDLRRNRLTRAGVCRFLDKIRKRRLDRIMLQGNPLDASDVRYITTHAARLGVDVTFT